MPACRGSSDGSSLYLPSAATSSEERTSAESESSRRAASSGRGWGCDKRTQPKPKRQPQHHTSHTTHHTSHMDQPAVARVARLVDVWTKACDAYSLRDCAASVPVPPNVVHRAGLCPQHCALLPPQRAVERGAKAQGPREGGGAVAFEYGDAIRRARVSRKRDARTHTHIYIFAK